MDRYTRGLYKEKRGWIEKCGVGERKEELER